MRQKKNRLLALLLAAALCAATLPLPASAAGSGVTAWSDKIGSSTAKLVSVPMGNGRTAEISLANNSVVEAVSAKTLIDQKNAQANTQVVAAINGGFFNSYTSGAMVYPDNCPQIQDAVVVDNKLIHSGRSAMLGFTPDGKAMVDWVELGNEVRLGNGFAVDTHYCVNTYLTDPYYVMLFNEHLTLPVNIPADSAMIFIKDGKVTEIRDGGALTVPKGTDVLVYNSGVATDERSWSRFPTVGMSAEIVLTASGTSRNDQWAAVGTALTGGPVLVKDGKNVVDDSRNNDFYNRDPKQKPDVAATRSFVGVMPSGDLVMGTVPSATFRQIAVWMVANGVKEGIAMDGGASSMLYANGSFVTQAGRSLASVLTIVDRPDSGSQPGGGGADDPTPSVPGADAPSSWAAADVQAAIDRGLVPDSLRSGYRDDITKQDFCLLIYELARKDPGFVGKLSANPEPDFIDVSHQTYEGQIIYQIGRLGIISGTANSDGTYRFEPSMTFNREMAATILAHTIQVVGGVQDTGKQHSYSDRSTFSFWAAPSIDFCTTEGIMQGSGGAFKPSESFTREQAIIAILHIYDTYL